MDSHKRKLANFSVPSELKSAGALSNAKMTFFTSGSSKKSKREKEKEAAEKKRREEEEAAAAAYKDFLEAFEGEEEEGPSGSSKPKKTFVKAGGEGRYEGVKTSSGSGAGGSGNGGGRVAMFGDEEEEVAKPPRRGPPTEPSRVREQREREEREAAASATMAASKKGSIMNNFLAELKRDSADKERYPPRRGPPVYDRPTVSGSHDIGDPQTTNVHVGNLPTTITEQVLGHFFAQYGSIGSIKIMWPREPGPSRNLGGFVAFMKRSDADRAIRESDGLELQGNKLRCGWGKAVNLPPKCLIESRREEIDRDRGRSRETTGRKRKPSYDSRSYSRSRSRGRSYSHSPSRSRAMSRKSKRARYSSRSLSRSQSRSRSRGRRRDRDRSRSYDPFDRASRSLSRSMSRSRSRSRDRRNWPTIDPTEETTIRAVAKKVKEHGPKFEKVMMEREADNPKFSFLRDEKSKGWIFFRMLLDDRWRPPTPEVEFEDEGANSIYSSDSAEDSEDERLRDRKKGKLGKLGRERFESMLRGITNTREKIARCMAFAIKHADACEEVADILIKSLLIPSTPIPRKIARLHVVSDILHNSSHSIQNVWRYRGVFESRLDVVFDHLNLIYRSFPSRLKAEGFRMKVMNCAGEWDKWLAFTPGKIEEWESRLVKKDSGELIQIFEGAEVEVEEKKMEEIKARSALMAERLSLAMAKSQGKEALNVVDAQTAIASNGGDGVETEIEQEDLDGVPLEDVDGAPLEDVDGVPLEDVDGIPMEDVDGEPMEYVDGAPMEDVDGSPMDDEQTDMFG